MGKTYCGLILKTAYDRVGDTSTMTALGKSFLEWVKLALADAKEISVADYDGTDDFPRIVKPFIKKDCDYIVVLFSDTPLVTGKTVAAAVEEAYAGNRTVLRMTRGYVFDCAYIYNAEKIYTENTFYFDEEDFITAFSYKQVGLITDILKNRILDFHMERGVRFTDLACTRVDCDVAIEPGAVIGCNNVISGKTKIKSGAVIGNGNVIEDCVISEGAHIESSHMLRSYIGRNTTVGPYANLRADNIVGDNCRVGDFVELKASKIGDGSKMGHLSYLGNVVMGKDCNVGAGVVFANYDGKDKHTTTVGNRVFVGSNSTVIAPVKLADGAFVAAGSTLNADVPEAALAVARARQTVIEGWTGNKYTAKKEEKK